MAFRTPELERGPVLEHGTSPIAGTLGIAIIVVALYFWQGRRIQSDTLRHIAWIAAASQALVALVPVLAIVVGTLALIAVAFIAVIALILLFTDRG